MIRRPPRSTRTDTLFPYTTLFRSGWVAGFLNDSFSHIQLRPVRFGWQGDYLGSFGQPIGNMACKPVVLNRVMHRQMTHWGILGSVDGKIIPDSENRFLRESFNFPDSLASLDRKSTRLNSSH